MAEKQLPAYLNLAELTASQFLEVWKHYDADGNGYIEGKELENFIRELQRVRKGACVRGHCTGLEKAANAIVGTRLASVEDPFKRRCVNETAPTVKMPHHQDKLLLIAAINHEEIQMKEFMEKYDKNADGRIEMAELAQILPTEENFLLCFRQCVRSSGEFMETWRKYDADCSGYIEANELKSFLRDLLKKANRHYDDKKLREYTQTILKMFDTNGDGKLGLSEMARLLPVQENFLLRFQDFRGSKGMKLNAEEFNAIFTFYDRDGNGYIDSHELDALLKDLYEKNKKEMDIKKMTAYKKNILSLSHGGKLYRRELEMILCTEPL